MQNVLQQQAEFFWQSFQQGAIIYICGDQHGLAKAVEVTWIRLIMQFEKVDLSAAENQWKAWRKQKRVQLDVY